MQLLLHYIGLRSADYFYFHPFFYSALCCREKETEKERETNVTDLTQTRECASGEETVFLPEWNFLTKTSNFLQLIKTSNFISRTMLKLLKTSVQSLWQTSVHPHIYILWLVAEYFYFVLLLFNWRLKVVCASVTAAGGAAARRKPAERPRLVFETKTHNDGGRVKTSMNHVTSCRKSWESLWRTLRIKPASFFPVRTHSCLWHSGENISAAPSHQTQRCNKHSSGQRHVWGRRRMSDDDPTMPSEATSCAVLRPWCSWGRPEL